MSYEIEDGIEIPPVTYKRLKKRARRWSMLKHMAIGGFYVFSDEELPAAREAARNYARRHPGWKWKVDYAGSRQAIWRLE